MHYEKILYKAGAGVIACVGFWLVSAGWEAGKKRWQRYRGATGLRPVTKQGEQTRPGTTGR